MRSRSATIRRRRSRICWRSWRRRGLARSVRLPSSSRAWRSASRRSVRRGQPSVSAATAAATGRTARPQACTRGPASSVGMSSTSSAPSSALPSAVARASTGRTSGMPSNGGGPSASRAWRASPVSAIAASTAATSTSGAASRACSRPMAVRASLARRDRTESHSVPRSTIRPAATRGLTRSRSGGTEVPESGVLLLGLIGRPLPARGLGGGQGLAFAANARLFDLGHATSLLQLPGTSVGKRKLYTMGVTPQQRADFAR